MYKLVNSKNVIISLVFKLKGICFSLFKVLKFLVSSGSKLNFRLYGEYLFDILFAGGVLGTCIPIL